MLWPTHWMAYYMSCLLVLLRAKPGRDVDLRDVIKVIMRTWPTRSCYSSPYWVSWERCNDPVAIRCRNVDSMAGTIPLLSNLKLAAIVIATERTFESLVSIILGF